MGNKKITQIAGLEFFNIDVEAFRNALKLKVQASTTCEVMEANLASQFLGAGMGANQNDKFMLIGIQGGQEKVLRKFFADSYCISEKYLKVMDNTVKSKKK